MMSPIQTFLIAYWYVVLPIVALLFAAIPVIVYWGAVKYWLLGVRLNMPLFGKVHYWVKHPGLQDEDNHFFGGEKELCGAYHKYHEKHDKDPEFFRKCQDYLRKINEDNRKEKGLGLWALIITLMVIEATAFGYALAPFALTLATPNTALAGAFALGLVISIIGLVLSEFSGRSLYLNSIVNHIMSYSSVRGESEDGDMLRKDLIGLENTFDDDHRPEFQRVLNRVKVPSDRSKPAKRYKMLATYGVFIVGLAVAAFLVRTETLNAQEADLISNPASVSQASDFPTAADDFPLTEEMAAVKSEAQNGSAQDQIDAMHRASIVTFSVLSALFIFIQFTSTYLAFSHGFAGSKSKEAWELTHAFANADEYIAFHRDRARSIAVDAQHTLGKLQGMLKDQFHVSGQGNHQKGSNLPARTFDRYVELMAAKASDETTKKVISDMLANLMETAETLSKQGDIARLAGVLAQADSVISTAQGGVVRPEILVKVQMYRGMVDADQRAKATPAPAVAAAPVAAPIVAQADPAPAPAAPAPAPASAAAAPVEVAQSAPASPAADGGGFNHNAWGDLTAYEVDDLGYVAKKVGATEAELMRARRLQVLDKGFA